MTSKQKVGPHSPLVKHDSPSAARVTWETCNVTGRERWFIQFEYDDYYTLEPVPEFSSPFVQLQSTNSTVPKVGLDAADVLMYEAGQRGLDLDRGSIHQAPGESVFACWNILEG